MRFVTVRDFRNRSAQIWKDLPAGDETVVTSNGKPVALLTPLSDKSIDETLRTIRKARALSAVISMQTQSMRCGNDALTLTEINKEIKAVRIRRK